MNEDSDNPNASGVVEFTPMEALNDELTSKTDKSDQELKDGSNIGHEMRGFEEYLVTSVQTILFYWPPILFSSIAFILYFFFKNDIIEILITWPELVPLFITSAILLMFKLSKKEEELNTKLGACIGDIVRYKGELEAKHAEFEQRKEECESEKNDLITNMECEVRKKLEEIAALKKCKDELMPRIAQLEDEAKAAKIRENCTPTEFTLHSEFTEISKFEDYKKVFSSPTVIDGITWKMGVRKTEYYIHFYLFAEKEDSDEWFCPVIDELRLMSQRSKEFVHREEMKLIFDAEQSLNYIGRIWIDDKEFIVDDSITVAIEIKAFPRSIHEATTIPLLFQFSDISKLKKLEHVYSEPTEVEGITWKMEVYKYSREKIGVYLDAEKKDAVEWLCPVIVDFQLASQTSGEMVHIERVKRMYYANDIEVIGYISKEDLNDEEKGFVLDDSIIVLMDIKAFPIN